MENIPNNRHESQPHFFSPASSSSSPFSSLSSPLSSLSSDSIPPLIDLNEEANRPIQPMPLHPHTLPPPPTSIPETNVCYDEQHPFYVGLLYRLNFLDLVTRATERELQGQIMFTQQNMRESALIINQLLVENMFVKTVLAEKERELNELKLALGLVKSENTTTNNTIAATAALDKKNFKNNLLPGTGNMKAEANTNVGRGRKNGVSRVQPTTQTSQTNIMNHNNTATTTHNDSTSSSASSSSPSSSSTSQYSPTYLLHTSANKNYPPYIYGYGLQGQPNKNIKILPTFQPPPQANISTTTTTTTTTTKAKDTTSPSITSKEPVLTERVENSQEKLATSTACLLRKVLIARKNSNSVSPTHFLVQLPATAITGEGPQKDFRPQIVSTVSLQNGINANRNNNVDESRNNKSSSSSNSNISGNINGRGGKRKAPVTFRNDCRIANIINNDNVEAPMPKLQRQTLINNQSEETIVHNSSQFSVNNNVAD